MMLRCQHTLLLKSRAAASISFRKLLNLRYYSANRLLELSSLNNTFCALRHGRSLANEAKVISSHPDVATVQHGLSPVGHEQAQTAGKRIMEYYRRNDLAGLVILTSDYLRAKETAEHVADEATKELKKSNELLFFIETRLRERWFGDWDGGSDEHYPTVWHDDALGGETKNGVESVESVMDRATQVVVEYDALYTNHLILLVAHGDVLQITQTAFEKLHGSKHRTIPHLETATLRPLLLK